MDSALFNSRETATAAWLAIGMVFGLSHAKIRGSLLNLIRASLHHRILILLLLMAIYTAGIVFILHAISFWQPRQLKDTVIWFFFTGIVLGFRRLTAKEPLNIFSSVFRDSVKIVIAVEFLLNTYTFPLPIEFILLPLIAVLAGMEVIAGTDEKYELVGKFIRALQSIVGLLIVTYVTTMAIIDLRDLASLNTLRDILLPPLLSILFTPCVYLIVLMSEYEQLFIPFKLGAKLDKALTRTAKRKLMLHLRLGVGKVHRFRRKNWFALMRVQSGEDVDALISTDGAEDETK